MDLLSSPSSPCCRVVKLSRLVATLLGPKGNPLSKRWLMIGTSRKGYSLFSLDLRRLLFFKEMLVGLPSRNQQKAKHHVNGVSEATFFIEICVSQPYTLDRILTGSNYYYYDYDYDYD